MSKRLVAFVAAFLVLVALYRLNENVRSFIEDVTFSIKKNTVSLIDATKNRLATFWHQSSTIASLEEKNRALQKYKILYNVISLQLQLLQNECNVTRPRFITWMRLVPVVSYVRFGDYTSMWLDAKLQENSLYGLLKDDSVAGIALLQKGHALALLNGNRKCSYGVITQDGAQGIAIGSGDNRYVMMKYIPTYEQVHQGDTVLTSGLDAIFPYGIRVGTVVAVWQEGSYKVAKVKTYADLHHPMFLWLMKL